MSGSLEPPPPPNALKIILRKGNVSNEMELFLVIFLSRPKKYRKKSGLSDLLLCFLLRNKIHLVLVWRKSPRMAHWVPKSHRQKELRWLTVDYLTKAKCHDDNQHTLQGINISHLGKGKILFKMPFLGDMLVSWRLPCGCFQKIVGFPPKSSILIGFSIINHPFWDTPIFGNTQISFQELW